MHALIPSCARRSWPEDRLEEATLLALAATLIEADLARPIQPPFR